MYQKLCFMPIFLFNLTNNECRHYIVKLSFQIKKLRLREVKKIFQGHTVDKWEIWDSKPITPEPELLSIIC